MTQKKKCSSLETHTRKKIRCGSLVDDFFAVQHDIFWLVFQLNQKISVFLWNILLLYGNLALVIMFNLRTHKQMNLQKWMLLLLCLLFGQFVASSVFSVGQVGLKPVRLHLNKTASSIWTNGNMSDWFPTIINDKYECLIYSD